MIHYEILLLWWSPYATILVAKVPSQNDFSDGIFSIYYSLAVNRHFFMQNGLLMCRFLQWKPLLRLLPSGILADSLPFLLLQGYLLK